MNYSNQKNNNTEVDFFNFYAICLLEQLGDDEPSQDRIDAVEKTFRQICEETLDQEILISVLKHWAKTVNTVERVS